MGHLAINNGEKVREKDFPPWPEFDEKEEEALRRVLHSRRWFSGFLGGGPGSEVAKFEEQFTHYHGAKYGIAVANGSAALEIALRSAGVGAGDEVIVPAYTFIATASAVLQVDAIPRIVDIEPTHCCIDPNAAEQAINKKTKAIIPVHYGGQIANMESLLNLAHKHNLYLIEDAAHAHGSVWKGQYAGTIGDMGCFSFQESKTMTSGEGGIILTNDETLAKLARSYRSNGREEGRPGYEHHRLGWNYRMTEFQAAILQVQLERLKEQVTKRTINANDLSERLREVPGFNPITDPEGMEINGHYLYSVRIDRSHFDNVEKEKIEEAIKAEGIPCSTLYLPINHSPMFKRENWEEDGMSFFSRYWKDKFDLDDVNTPEAGRAFREIIEFPHNVLLGEEEDMDDIVLALQKVSKYSHELS